jgi:hypothetical protein
MPSDDDAQEMPAWERVAQVIEAFMAEIEEEPPIVLPTQQQRARGAYSACVAYAAEIKSGPYRELEPLTSESPPREGE